MSEVCCLPLVFIIEKKTGEGHLPELGDGL